MRGKRNAAQQMLGKQPLAAMSRVVREDLSCRGQMQLTAPHLDKAEGSWAASSIGKSWSISRWNRSAMPRRSDLPSNGDDARVSKRLAMRWLETTGRRMANPAQDSVALAAN